MALSAEVADALKLGIDCCRRGDWNEGLRHLVAEMGPNQIVYGTDTPFNWPDTLDLIVNAKYLSDAEKEAMLGGNLIRMLKIAA